MEQREYDITYEDLNPTLLFSCILERTATEENYHAHDSVEIVIILEGEGGFHIDGTDYPAKAGDIFILNPGTYHKSLCTGSGRCAVECYLNFTDIAFRDCAPDTFPLFPGGHILHSMNKALSQQITALCSSISNETKNFRAGRDFMLKSYLVQILCLLVRSQQEKPEEDFSPGYVFRSTNKQYIVKRITDYMEEHYREKISLNQIAANMYLSTFYISKIFKSETGDTPINYLIRLRMEKAKELLLKNPGATIQEIADEVGYSDTYHFSKLFKKCCQVPPSYYKKNL